VKAAWTAAEAAMRYLKVGEKNYSVTDIVDKVTSIWECKPVESEFQRIVITYTKTLTKSQTCSHANIHKMSSTERSKSY
jgi:hypothetical protein